MVGVGKTQVIHATADPDRHRIQLRGGYLGISLLGHSQTWVRVNQATVTAYWRAKEQQWQTHGSQR
jgi:hypothetical protein